MRCVRPLGYNELTTVITAFLEKCAAEGKVRNEYPSANMEIWIGQLELNIKTPTQSIIYLPTGNVGFIINDEYMQYCNQESYIGEQVSNVTRFLSQTVTAEAVHQYFEELRARKRRRTNAGYQ